MPEFVPEHVPSNVDSFTAGYFACAEWLIDETINRDTLRGWSKDAITKATEDCRGFQEANESALALYSEISGRDDESAGHDFYLSRCGHGAGFFDRGNEPVFCELQNAARGYGDADTYRHRGKLYFY